MPMSRRVFAHHLGSRALGLGFHHQCDSIKQHTSVKFNEILQRDEFSDIPNDFVSLLWRRWKWFHWKYAAINCFCKVQKVPSLLYVFSKRHIMQYIGIFGTGDYFIFILLLLCWPYGPQGKYERSIIIIGSYKMKEK